MKIALIYPGHNFSTFDVAEGHDKALRELGHEVFGVRYDNTWQFYSESLSHWALMNPEWQVDASNAWQMASERAAVDIVRWKPDVALVVSGTEFHLYGYEVIQAANIPIVLMFTESPYGDVFHEKLIDTVKVHGAFTNDKSTVHSLSEAGKIPIAYLPHSYQPDKHKKREGLNGKYRSDVFFFGTMFPERMTTFYALREDLRGMRVIIDGPEPNKKGIAPLRPVPNEELVKFYSGTKIALNQHRLHNGPHKNRPGEAYSIGPRAYEIAAVGAFQLCDSTRKELFDVFDETVPTYDTDEELSDLAQYFLQHESDRLEYAAAAHEMVKNCTFKNRDEEIVIPFLEEVV